MDDQLVVATYQELGTQVETAKYLGISQSTVSSVLRRNGICIGRGGKQRCDHQHLLGLWNKHGKTYLVAKEMGIAQGAVARILREKFGIAVPRGSATKYSLPMEELVERYEAGETCGEIAKDYGLTPERVRRRLIAEGVKIRSAAESVPRGKKNIFYKNGAGRSYEEKAMHYYRRQCYEVAAICFGQPLPRGCVIHHVNENPRDNRPENLLVFPSVESHSQFHTQQLSLQRKGVQVDAIQLALESGAQKLPPPPHSLQLEPDIDQHALSSSQEKQSGTRPRWVQSRLLSSLQ